MNILVLGGNGFIGNNLIEKLVEIYDNITVFDNKYPDKKYDNTYHNMGYKCVDYFAKQNGISFTKNKYQAMYGDNAIWCRPLPMWNDVVEFNGKKYE